MEITNIFRSLEVVLPKQLLYPLELVTEILRGMRDTFDAEHPENDSPSREIKHAMARASMIHDEPPSLLASLKEDALRTAHPSRTATFKMSDGSSKTVPLQFRSVYRDEYTNEPLPTAWVQDSMQQDLD